VPLLWFSFELAPPVSKLEEYLAFPGGTNGKELPKGSESFRAKPSRNVR
jgi:hypothetical protein